MPKRKAPYVWRAYEESAQRWRWEVRRHEHDAGLAAGYVRTEEAAKAECRGAIRRLRKAERATWQPESEL